MTRSNDCGHHDCGYAATGGCSGGSEYQEGISKPNYSQADRIRFARESDPGYQERTETDWRPQEVHEVEEFR